MFLDLLKRRNPAFLEAVATLHQSGQLPANCYAIDLDAVVRNAAAIKSETDRLGLRAYVMTKQIGRNPDVSKALVGVGLTHAVGVDLDCALAAASGGLGIGHLGHLVQIPRGDAAIAAGLEPDFWTVFSAAKAAEAATASSSIGRDQALLLRVYGPGDNFYRGHEGGVSIDDVVELADQVDHLDGAHFAGVTTFPATLFDQAARTVKTTPNFETIRAAAAALRAAGRQNVEVNAPGTTSAAMLQMLADGGATQVEPGHGLTGTTPWHAVEDLVEDPAIAYVSEISHCWQDRAFFFGGGLYVDPVLPHGPATRAVVAGRGADSAEWQTVPVEMPAPQAIDYYATLGVADAPHVQPGDSVILGFRPQVFVTRARTAAIAGVASGNPTVLGVWASDGSACVAAPDSVRSSSIRRQA